MSRPHFLQTAWAVHRHPLGGRAELDRYRDARLRRLVLHAYENIPFYRKLFDRHRLHPRHIRGTVDLDLIPVTTKQELRRQPLSALTDRSATVDRLLPVWTSGSTSEPFMLRRTGLEQVLNLLFRHRFQKAYGLGVGDRVMTIGPGRWVDPTDSKLVGRLLRRLCMPAEVKVDGMAPPEDVVRQIEAFRPHMLVGLPGVLSLTADYLLAHGRRDIRPRILVVSGEVLTPITRGRLTQAFGVEPLQTYASHEVPLMGWECPVSGEIHTCDDAVILEVLRDGKPALPGEDGEVVVTNLHSYAMPFIRYRLGDVVTRGSNQCACNQPFSTIRAIRGRMNDYFSLPDGRRLHPYRILETLPGDAWIRQYQLLQDRPDRIVMQVVPSEPPTAEMQDRIFRVIGAVLGSGIEFQVRLVESIPFEPGGKYRHSRSLVSSDYQSGPV